MKLSAALEWADPRPAGNPTEPAFDMDLYDVVPIPFYPDDLPALRKVSWPEKDMRELKRLARRWLHVAPPTPEQLAA